MPGPIQRPPPGQDWPPLATLRLAFVMRAILVLAVLAAVPPSAWSQSALAVVGATVIDGTGRTPIPNATVLIQGDKIVAVGPAAQVVIPPGATRIDARGKFLVAGLWDVHVHLNALGRTGLPTLVRYGITSVRDLGGGLDSVRTWRDEIVAGRLVGPRIHLAGPIVENGEWLRKVASLDVPGLRDLIRDRIPVATEAEARRAVDSLAGLGVEVLKIRNSPPLDAYRALIAAAERRGLLVAGHQPNPGVGLAGALAAGQRSIEHIEQLAELESLPAASRDSMVGAFARAAIWFTPTLVTSFRRFDPESLTTARVAGTAGEPEQALVTPALRAFWRVEEGLKPFDTPIEVTRLAVDSGLAGMRRLWAGSVKVMTGTDLGALNVYPGEALHEELRLLVDSLGLTPLQAIQAATVEPARYFRLDRSIGTVEPGHLADLVVLSADPLADIRNTRRIEMVIHQGRITRPASPP